MGRFRLKRKLKKTPTLYETYLDKTATNDGFSVHNGEGHLRHSVEPRQVRWLWLIFAVAVFTLLLRVSYLQVIAGSEYAFVSENNTFAKKIVLPIRGDIYDRNGELLAWNVGKPDKEVPERVYRGSGFSTLLGFIRYPQKDNTGEYYRPETQGEGGIEETYNTDLAGANGSLVLEQDVIGNIVSEVYIEEQVDGKDITLSIDANVQQILFDAIKRVADERNFKAGSGVLLNSDTGEILALTSYPEFDNTVITNLSAAEQETYLQNQEDGAFVHRAVSGLYSPGSTIKPFFAVAALEEQVVDPHDIIVSTGAITVQNPYDPDVVYTYRDWRAHGPLDIYSALSQSSNVYFYYVGGGYGDTHEGLGIDRIKTYANIFRFGEPTTLGTFHEPNGLVPNPEWKRNLYDEEWRIGDTYNTVIGQYAFQVTPLQLARATAVFANGGYILNPHFNNGEESKRTKLFVSDETLAIVQQGMRQGVLNGTAKALNSKAYNIAAKTGTAQVGNNGILNSLLVGFFPYENPKYTFAIVMERGRQGGAVAVARQFFDTLKLQDSVYLTP